MTAESPEFTTRRATPADAAAIAAAHRDSIATLGPRFYPSDVVTEWGSGLTPALYVRAMKHGETFFIAETASGSGEVLGFATHRIDDGEHGTAVYVRGTAARRGVGSALYRLAEAEAVSAGGRRITIDASLAAVGFYKAHGFVETGRGEHRLRSGALMACVFMRKSLSYETEPQTRDDRSNGYEASAADFITGRSTHIGVAAVRTWARSLKPGASILDLGCGHGVPIAKALLDDGFEVFGIDASPSLTSSFRARFPRAQVRCEPVESSCFFGRRFDGIVAIGLIFLLPSQTQVDLIRQATGALNAGGRLLFTSPAQVCTWTDVLTARESRSLGAEAYKKLLADAGLEVVSEYVDEGENHYYDAVKRSADSDS
jgi:SAM-dependent methyltransferase/ribosomal protein S18 acetylase RimI-like enzyme